MSFLASFFEVTEGASENAVCCPFDHYTTNGIPYKESNPSAHINTIKNLFHCKVCNTGYNEPQFIQQITGCSFFNAKKIQRYFETEEDIHVWKEETLSSVSKEKALQLGISEKIIEELMLKTPPNTDAIAFPVFMFNHLIDVRIYNPEKKPKIKSRANCGTGFIIPFDTWRETKPTRMTLICAGEKDMAVARSHGFNAITITGGEQTLPTTPNFFKDREISILYDNDNAGLTGARKLALELYNYTNKVKIVTNFHNICKEQGEDITDFFMKYQKTANDLKQYINETSYFEPTSEEINPQHPIVDLLTASKPENVGKMLRSNIQIVAVSESTFAVPSNLVAEKIKTTEDTKETMQVGDFKEWKLTNETIQDILHMIDNSFKEDTIKTNIKTKILKLPKTERYIQIHHLQKETVFKGYVTDLYETSNTSTQPMEYTAYSIGHKLESGKKYLVTYKLVPHPYKGQELIMLITHVVEANDSVSNFTTTPEAKQNLDIIRNLPGTVEEKIQTLTHKIKGLLGYNGNDTLIQAIDLGYHTPLQFNFGSFENMRAYLDMLIVGESRMGKSSTAETLRDLYGLGMFTSLAGNSATIPGLVGGSNKMGNSYQTRAGIIPQNHQGLIIFEEFGKSNANVVSELTDIRSSNEVRITRVSGTITLPAMVRMIALSNVKSINGSIKPIASYPNGISIITELVPTAEDIARYDLIVVLPDRGESQIDPFWSPDQPLDKKVYQTRIRWVWSRSPEQIVIDKDTGYYIIEQANKMNQLYDCHIKIFGTEAWKKIARLAVAIAGYVVSTDDSYENIIVTKEHVDHAVHFFQSIYDNKTFKLKEYVDHERKYVEVNNEAIANLQDIYTKYPSLILYLEQASTGSKSMLEAASGLSRDELNKAINRLAKGLFVRFHNHDIIPTERFRLALANINKETVIERVGE